jgi:hypothetical protein
MNPCDSGPLASPDSPQHPSATQQWLWDIQTSILQSYLREGLILARIPQILEVSAATHALLVTIRDSNITKYNNAEKHLYKIDERVIALQANQHQLFNDVYNKMDTLLQKIDTTWTENTALCEAYCAVRGLPCI